MNKIYLKLIAISLTLVLSVSVVAMSSYAWLVLSSSPAVSGIQVAIGGGNTILVAPDITEVVDGQVYHYPGTFSDTMNFSKYTTYSYLSQVEGLTPVSTVDGVNWFMPEYYDYSDEEVRHGRVLSGSLKDVSEFSWEAELEHANIPAGNDDLSKEGSYIYLDFWVVSPGDNFTLRISTGTETGSFVLDLMDPQERTDESGGLSRYTLEAPVNQGAAAIRVGFLANPIRLTDDSMLNYQNSIFFDSRFTSLRGMYQEPGTGNANLPDNRFTIYEPNADVHPYGDAEPGSYVQTKPVGVIDGEIQTMSVYDRLTIQRGSTWTQADNGLSLAIEQWFQAAMLMKEGMTPEEISNYFYGEYLQWQIAPCVDKGRFIKRTSPLSMFGNTLTEAEFSAMDSAGATDDVYIIKLERNVPQRIRMFIWLEGQDVDCVNAVSTSNLVVNLELAGANDELQ